MQGELTLQAREELEAILGEMKPDLAEYRKRYERDVANYAKVVSRSDLIDRLSKADLIYIGDYHPLRQAQKTLMRIVMPVSRSHRA